jgi:hypothetical protein
MFEKYLKNAIMKKKRTIQPIVSNYGCWLGPQIAWGVMSWFKDDQVHSLPIHVYETLETPSKYKFLFEDVVPPLWLTYLGENKTTLGKKYQVKVWYYWEHLGEHIANLRNPLKI